MHSVAELRRPSGSISVMMKKRPTTADIVLNIDRKAACSGEVCSTSTSNVRPPTRSLMAILAIRDWVRLPVRAAHLLDHVHAEPSRPQLRRCRCHAISVLRLCRPLPGRRKGTAGCTRLNMTATASSPFLTDAAGRGWFPETGTTARRCSASLSGTCCPVGADSSWMAKSPCPTGGSV